MRDEGGVGWVIWGWFEWAGKQLSSWWCLVLLVFELLWALVKFRFQSHRLGDFGFIESSFTVVETLTTNARGQQFQATLHLEDLKWMNYKWITYLKSNVWTKLRETFGVHWSMLCPSLQSFQSLHYLLRNRRLFEHTACNAFFFWQNAIKCAKCRFCAFFFFSSISMFFWLHFLFLEASRIGGELSSAAVKLVEEATGRSDGADAGGAAEPLESYFCARGARVWPWKR